ncbi:uncharacterized protein EI90DRAFT_3114679 [Cantharellus anzutake]|uniref:uncharacterized protein n=1 Tax=Cantharellus anzutake TaxID=1750568 RepID=UPI0019035893|nr:uncharacterized protein EI90DRAFT_3114679 [Cantharellus anzutake]KAF8344023.1 hypothetical protein EI90DRAFT_3114679 [Cantharellus anzutake]
MADARHIAHIIEAALFEENFSFLSYETVNFCINKQRSGALHAPCIKATILSYFTSSQKRPKETIHRHTGLFTAISPELVAFALITIECALREWVGGSRTVIAFSSESFSGRFAGHLKWIHEWGKRSPDNWREVSDDLLKAVATRCEYTECRDATIARVLHDDD